MVPLEIPGLFYTYKGYELVPKDLGFQYFMLLEKGNLGRH
jgi:hypothetical protein